jgi:hypothetical protein
MNRKKSNRPTRRNDVVRGAPAVPLHTRSNQKTLFSSKTWHVFLDGRPLELVTSDLSEDAIASVAACYSIAPKRLAVINEDVFERFERHAERIRRRRLLAASYHEAGHAVMVHHLGAIVEFVSTIPEIEYKEGAGLHTFAGGYCDWRTLRNHPRWIPGTGLNSEGKALVALAGLAAEFRFTGRSRWQANFFASDVEEAFTLADQLGEQDPIRSEKIFEIWREAAIERIEDLWEHVMRVAGALVQHRELARQGLERLLHPIPREPLALPPTSVRQSPSK